MLKLTIIALTCACASMPAQAQQRPSNDVVPEILYHFGRHDNNNRYDDRDHSKGNDRNYRHRYDDRNYYRDDRRLRYRRQDDYRYNNE